MTQTTDSKPQPARVCAVVVTFKRQELLSHCLLALQRQTCPPDHILVVDNASNDGTLELLTREFPSVETLPLPENVGGAGGFHAGMKHAFDGGFDWLWLMDDDGKPAPDCLALLLDAGEEPGVRVPLQQDRAGRLYGVSVWKRGEVDVAERLAAKEQAVEGKWVFRFVGPLIAREVVEKVGLPREEFFIWFDDIEYALRIGSRTKFPVVAVPRALFAHDFGTNPREARFLWRRSLRSYYAPWKLYYGARNPLTTFLHERRRAGELRHFLKMQLRHLCADLVWESDRWERAQMRLRGLFDGWRQNMGKRH